MCQVTITVGTGSVPFGSEALLGLSYSEAILSKTHLSHRTSAWRCLEMSCLHCFTLFYIVLPCFSECVTIHCWNPDNVFTLTISGTSSSSTSNRPSGTRPCSDFKWRRLQAMYLSTKIWLFAKGVQWMYLIGLLVETARIPLLCHVKSSSGLGKSISFYRCPAMTKKLTPFVVDGEGRQQESRGIVQLDADRRRMWNNPQGQALLELQRSKTNWNETSLWHAMAIWSQMSKDVKRCQKMSKDVKWCQKMSKDAKDVKRCQMMSKDVKRCGADLRLDPGRMQLPSSSKLFSVASSQTLPLPN